MTHPLDLVEIRTLIGTFLKSKDLAACTRVCKAWKDYFIPLLYHECGIISYRFRNPTSETINKYEEFIRVLKIGLFKGIESLHCSKLTTLILGDHDELTWDPSQHFPLLVELIQGSSQTLKQFTLCPRMDTVLIVTSTVFWDALAQCTSLSELWLTNIFIPSQDTGAFWRVCSQVSRLRLHEIKFDIDFEEILATFPPEGFPNMRELKLYSHKTFDSQIMLEILSRSPNLNLLDLRPDFQDFIDGEFKRLIPAQLFSNLQSLTLTCYRLDDDQLASILDNMLPAKKLKTWDSSFAEKSYQSFMKNHAETIQALELYDCSTITSAMAQGILSGCPSLESFIANTIQGTDLARIELTDSGDETVVLGKEWVCLQLKYLCIRFDMSSTEADIDQSTPEGEARFKRQQRLEQEHAFRQLSRLTKLRTLIFYGSGSDGIIRESLQLKLKSRGGELDRLATLKDLIEILFYETEQDMSEEEFDWIGGNWPNIDSMKGRFHSDEKRNEELENCRNRLLGIIASWSKTIVFQPS